MIKSLEITNFQSHKDSALEFSDGVNIIIGQSDSGKSAILRALRWCIWNRPSGDAIRSHWGGKTSTTIVTDEGWIIRSKDKEEEYQLQRNNKILSFKAFRTDVPKEIQDALNITEVNLAQQLDQPFLLSDTAGEVASYFNKIARLDKIDTGTQNVNKEINELTSTIGKEATKDRPATGLIKQIKEAEEQLKKFVHLEKFEIDLEVLEEMDKQFTTKCSSYDKLGQLIEKVKGTEDDIEEESKILSFEKPLNNILNLIEKRDELKQTHKKLDNLWVEINLDQADLDKQSELIELEKPVNSILKLYENKKTLANSQNSLSKALSVINSTSIRLERENRNLIGLQEEFDREMPIGSLCPLCNQKILK
jgi:exonuclease SbcC